MAGLSATSEARILLGHPPRGREPYWEREGVRFATAVIAVAIAWIVDPNGHAKLIRRRLSNEGDESRAAWDATRKCYQRIYPRALALEPKWEEWLERVRAEYRRRYAEVDDEDLEPPDTAGTADAPGYETHLTALIDGTLERTRYEKDALRRLSAMAESYTEREAVGAISREYDERMRNQVRGV